MADEVSVSPLERSIIPIGTVEEAQREGLDVTQYATCGRPNPASGVVGCAWRHKCIVSAKDVSGPRNYGVEILKGASQGGGFVKVTRNCMWIADHEPDIVRNGGALKVIANENETFEKIDTIAINSATREPTHQKDPMAIREKRRVKETVKPYPRPGENPMLLTDVLRAESIEAEKERRSDDATARAYGLGHTIPPIDKRPSGPDGGRKAAGGGGTKG